ncbi:MAG TPA: hypothetical protein VFP17_00290 [Solirubrobacterales bacterium]|nr:hypothetical protein [Solirubrobacterales bacterium]
MEPKPFVEGRRHVIDGVDYDCPHGNLVSGSADAFQRIVEKRYSETFPLPPLIDGEPSENHHRDREVPR